MDRTILTSRDLAVRNRKMGPGSPEAAAPDKYTDRLLKYIPPDVIAAYTALQGLVSAAHSPNAATASWVVFVVILIATPVYLWRVARIRKPAQIGIATVAFLVWAFAYPGLPFSGFGIEPLWGAIALGLYTFLVPMLEV